MLLFIATVLSNNKVISKFQYISCYCLSIWIPPCHCIKAISIHLMLLFISSSGFNIRRKMSFQYISCYCLSQMYILFSVLSFSFQYISCYCLSPILPAVEYKNSNFNTSHVTVYLVRMWFWKWHIHFNTSHVTVYRKTWREAVSCYIRISIHLMLLFILMLMQMKTIKIHFNTSHVTVYRR